MMARLQCWLIEDKGKRLNSPNDVVVKSMGPSGSSAALWTDGELLEANALTPELPHTNVDPLMAKRGDHAGGR
jgi:hypothetical protein